MSDARIDKLEHRLEALEGLVLDLIARAAPPEPAPPPPPAAPRGGVAPSAPRPPASGKHAVLRVAERRFGVPIARLDEVVRMPALSPVPGAHPALEGLLDLRGRTVEVLDLRAAFGLEPLADDLDARVVIVRSGERAFGLKADEVQDLLPVDPGMVAPAPAHAASGWLAGVAHSGGRVILLLDVDALVASLACGATSLDPGVADEADRSPGDPPATPSEGPP